MLNTIALVIAALGVLLFIFALTLEMRGVLSEKAFMAMVLLGQSLFAIGGLTTVGAALSIILGSP